MYSMFPVITPISVCRRNVLFCLFWMPSPSLSSAEQRCPSMSHQGPMVCLTRWDRCTTVCDKFNCKIKKEITGEEKKSGKIKLFVCAACFVETLQWVGNLWESNKTESPAWNQQSDEVCPLCLYVVLYDSETDFR